jgi:hypothetical protein
MINLAINGKIYENAIDETDDYLDELAIEWEAWTTQGENRTFERTLKNQIVYRDGNSGAVLTAWVENDESGSIQVLEMG